MSEKRKTPENKMFYQTWWFWLILAGFILGLVALLGPRNNTQVSDSTAATTGLTGVEATTNERKDVVLLSSGYTMSEDDDYIYWAAEFQNPEGNSAAYNYTKIIVTAYDESGAVLATEDQIMHSLQPGERQIFGSTMSSNGQKPSRVDFSIESGTAKTPNEEALKASDFQIEGVNEREGQFGGKSFTGTVKNNGKKDTDQVCVVVALKQDGKVVFAFDTFIDALAVGQQKPFELGTYSHLPSYNSYEVMAFTWG